MAITNRELVGKGLDLLREGLTPFVSRELQARDFVDSGRAALNHKPVAKRDVASLLKLIRDNWQSVFQDTMGRAERNLVYELVEWRNKWAHQEDISSDDAYRALDSASRLLAAVSVPQSEELDRLKRDLLRVQLEHDRDTNPQARQLPARRSTTDSKAEPRQLPTGGHGFDYIEIMEPLVLVSITFSFHEGCDVYEAVRYAWRVDVERIRRYKLVLAHVRGSVKGAYRPTQWLAATCENFPLMEAIPGRRGNEMTGRYGFVGERVEDALWSLYVGKRVPGRYLKQSSNPIRYLEPGE